MFPLLAKSPSRPRSKTAQCLSPQTFLILPRSSQSLTAVELQISLRPPQLSRLPKPNALRLHCPPQVFLVCLLCQSCPTRVHRLILFSITCGPLATQIRLLIRQTGLPRRAKGRASGKGNLGFLQRTRLMRRRMMTDSQNKYASLFVVYTTIFFWSYCMSWLQLTSMLVNHPRTTTATRVHIFVQTVQQTCCEFIGIEMVMKVAHDEASLCPRFSRQKQT